MRIGLDFDNTLIRYDDVFATAARDRGLVNANFSGNKQEVRDAIRLLPDGEFAWQRRIQDGGRKPFHSCPAIGGGFQHRLDRQPSIQKK